jgi:hypothetical protein
VQARHSAIASKSPGEVACLVLNLAGAIHIMEEILDSDDVVQREKQNRGWIAQSYPVLLTDGTHGNSARSKRNSASRNGCADSPDGTAPYCPDKLAGFVNESSPADSYQRPTPPAFAGPRAPRPATISHAILV